MQRFAHCNVFRAALGCILAWSLASASMGREWRTSNNLFKIDGEEVAYDGKTVTVKLPDGKTISLPIDKLNEQSQAYLKQTYPDGLKEQKPEPSGGKPADPPAGEPGKRPPAKSVKKPAARPRPTKPNATVAARPVSPSPTNVPAAAPDGVSVEVVSLTVTKPPRNGAGDGFVTSGTQIRLLVSDPARTITGLDSAKSMITECIDNKRTNLTQASDGASSDGLGALMLDVAPDGKSGTIEVTLPQIPDSRATRIRIQGQLHVVCGSGDMSETVAVPVSIILGIGL